MGMYGNAMRQRVNNRRAYIHMISIPTGQGFGMLTKGDEGYSRFYYDVDTTWHDDY
jgi:hypothetical protein